MLTPIPLLTLKRLLLAAALLLAGLGFSYHSSSSLDKQVTSRFPSGFSVLDIYGQCG